MDDFDLDPGSGLRDFGELGLSDAEQRRLGVYFAPGIHKKFKNAVRRAKKQLGSNVRGAKRIPANVVKTVASAASPIFGFVTKPIKIVFFAIVALIALPFVIRAISRGRKS